MNRIKMMRTRLLYRLRMWNLLVMLTLVLGFSVTVYAANLIGHWEFEEGSGSRYFNGLIDDVRIYDGPLTEAEITDLYQSGGVSFADYLPLDTSTRILVTTRGDQGDLGRTYVNRVIGTEVINGTTTTKIGVIPYESGDGLYPFWNFTNDGTTVGWWGIQTGTDEDLSVTIDPPLYLGNFNDGDVIPSFQTNATDRCTQITESMTIDPLLIDIRDITVLGGTYPDAITLFWVDTAYPPIPVNFGPNTLGFPETYEPNANDPLPGALTGFTIFARDVGLIVIGDIDAATGNVPGIVELQSIPSNPLVGKWGYQVLQHGSTNVIWRTESGVVTFNNDGTGTSTYTENEDGVIRSGTGTFTYSTSTNQDGSITLITVDEDGTDIIRLVLSDDGKMIILDDTSNTI